MMNQAIRQPDWMQDYVPAQTKQHYPTQIKAARTNPSHFKPGQSGNPAGRKPGKVITKRERIAQALDGKGPEVIRVVIEAALEGDMTAAGLVLSRLVPPVRPQSEPVNFTFDPDLPLSGQLAQVAVAVASGQVPPDVGTQISAMLSNLANVRASENLEQRIIALEAKAINP